MKFHFEYSVSLPIPLDLVFHVLTSVEYLPRVIALSGLASDVDIISIEGSVVRFKFFETIPTMFNFFQSKLPVIVKQTVNTEERMLTFESSVYEDMITLLKKRIFTEVNSNTTQVTEIVDGQCSFVYARVAKQLGESTLRQQMNAYQSLFTMESEKNRNVDDTETSEEHSSNHQDNESL